MDLVNIDKSVFNKLDSARVVCTKIKREYSFTQKLLLRFNPIRVFKTNSNDHIKMWFIRSYIDSKNIIGSLRSILSVKENKDCHLQFLMYLCNKFSHVKDVLISLYDTMNTWDIAKYLRSNQSCIRKLYGDKCLNVSNRSMRCSKIHLATKPIIESILDNSTITEHYLYGYWIDEFCPVRNLCIEIDGRWCHDKDYDRCRDDLLLSKGYKTIRIPAYSSREFIEIKLLGL